MHGAEFYASKRHKGTPSNNSSDDGNGGISHANGFDSSPRSEDHHSGAGGKNTSVSSKFQSNMFSLRVLNIPQFNINLMIYSILFKSKGPSIKSESDANSPGQPSNSPMAMQHNINGVPEEYEYMPSTIVMGMPIGGENVSGLDDSAWPYEVDDLDVNEMPYALREMVGLSDNGDMGFGRMGDSVVAPAQYMTDRNPRNRFKPRLQAKSGLSPLSNIPEINRRTCQRPIETAKRITEFKIEPGTTLPSETELPSATTRQQFPPSTTIPTNANAVRRDSLCSNASSFYYR